MSVSVARDSRALDPGRGARGMPGGRVLDLPGCNGPVLSPRGRGPALDPWVADIGELYRVLSPRLQQIVRLDVRASDPVVEDACQFAWDRLLHHRCRVRRETALSWLARTAVHEAWKLLRREGRCLSLDEPADVSEEPPLEAEAASPERLVEQRERLASIGLLPERQQRVLWLHALGLTYSEIAIYTGYTPRTVERQLLRAKRAVRQAAA